jgi:hypothetical protein
LKTSDDVLRKIGELIQSDKQIVWFVDDMSNILLIECRKGWTFYLTNSKSILEDALIYVMKIESVKNVINVGLQARLLVILNEKTSNETSC